MRGYGEDWKILTARHWHKEGAERMKWWLNPWVIQILLLQVELGAAIGERKVKHGLSS